LDGEIRLIGNSLRHEVEKPAAGAPLPRLLKMSVPPFAFRAFNHQQSLPKQPPQNCVSLWEGSERALTDTEGNTILEGRQHVEDRQGYRGLGLRKIILKHELVIPPVPDKATRPPDPRNAWS